MMRSSAPSGYSAPCLVQTLLRPVCPGDQAGEELSCTFLTAGGYRVRFARRLRELGPDWEALTLGGDVFLEPGYLSVLEAAPPEGMEFAYLLFYRGQRPVGAAVLQLLEFDATRAIRERRRPAGGFSVSGFVKDWLARHLKLRLLVCGNLLVTGEHGFYFCPDCVSRDQVFTLLGESLSQAAKALSGAGSPVQAMLIKDLPPENPATGASLKKHGFHKVRFQPNMVFELRPEWKQFEDYLAGMSSKYRVRARRAAKKAADIRRCELQADDLMLRREELYACYESVAESAGFNLVRLHPDYLLYLKQALAHRFRVSGYFLPDGRLAGYATMLWNGEELEAHFLGFDPKVNRERQLYLNMLYDIVGQGISGGASRIIFARTAMEIKSSVGATPMEMDLFLCASNALLNRFAPVLVRFLEPREEWTARHPFSGDDVSG